LTNENLVLYVVSAGYANNRGQRRPRQDK